MDQKTPADLAVFIQAQHIAAELVIPAHETPTVPLAARAMGCLEDQIVKSVLFLIKREEQAEPILIIASGTGQIDFRKLAERFGVSRKRIRLAPAEVVLAQTGYPAGGVPPFGFDRPIATFMDQGVFAQTVVFAGGGDDRTLLRTTPAEIERVTGAQIIDARAEEAQAEEP